MIRSDADRLVSSRSSPLRGAAALPGDKSLSHRAALLAAMAEGESRVENFLDAGVTRAMLQALSQLGVAWELQGSRLTVAGQGLAGFRPPGAPINCGNSATTMRLLAGVLAAARIPAVLDGSAGLRSRPMGRIVTPLRAMGAPLESAPGGTAPLVFSSQPASQALRGIEHHLSVPSAQVKSCLLLAGLAAEGETVLHEPGVSRDHTERMLRGLGISVHSTLNLPVSLPQPAGRQATASLPGPAVTTRLFPPRPLTLPTLHCRLPGDFSSAAFLIVAALVIPDSQIVLRGVGLNPTRTGLLDALLSMGADIRVLAAAQAHGEPLGDLQVHASPLQGIAVDGPLVARMIDEFPIFAVAAALAEGTTVVRGAGELRHKEADRISALCMELRKLGVDVRETADGFEIRGGRPIRGAVVQAHGDHRLAMALAVAGLVAATPVTVQGGGAVSESFPAFVRALQGLGANLRVEH